MCSKFTLLAILLLVSATLAVPASLVEAPPARRSEDHQSPPINRVASRADASTSTSNLWYDSYVAGTSFSGTISVRIIPMVHDHVRSHSFFANRGFGRPSMVSSPSQPFSTLRALVPLFISASTAAKTAPGTRSNLVSPTTLMATITVRDVELPL